MASTDAAAAPGGEAWKAQLQLPPKDTRIRTEVREGRREKEWRRKREKEKENVMPSKRETTAARYDARAEEKRGSEKDSTLPSNLLVLDASVRNRLECGPQQVERKGKIVAERGEEESASAAFFIPLGSRRLFWMEERQSRDGATLLPPALMAASLSSFLLSLCADGRGAVSCVCPSEEEGERERERGVPAGDDTEGEAITLGRRERRKTPALSISSLPPPSARDLGPRSFLSHSFYFCVVV